MDNEEQQVDEQSGTSGGTQKDNQDFNQWLESEEADEVESFLRSGLRVTSSMRKIWLAARRTAEPCDSPNET